MNAALVVETSFLLITVSNDSGRVLRDLEFSAWETFDDRPPQRVGRFLTASRVPDGEHADGSPGGRTSNGGQLRAESALLIATFLDAQNRWWMVRSNRQAKRLKGAALREWRLEGTGAESARATVRA